MLSTQIIWLFVLSIPVACISWTVVREEVFREPRDYCVEHSKSARNILIRKFFYLFTCEYCFSHYVTIVILVLSGFKLLFDDWRGILIAGFSIVGVANVYMSLFARIRAETKTENLEAKVEEKRLNARELGS